MTAHRLAFIGGWGHHVVRGATRDEAMDIEAVAVASDRRDDERTRWKFQSDLESGATWYDDPVRMLDEFKPTAVNIGGVYAHDGPLAVEALQRDIPVVVEKPIAATWDDYHALREVTDDTNRVLLTEFASRSTPAFRAARQAVQAGRIGTPVLATGQKTYRFGDHRPDFYKRRADFGSTLLWVASHALDWIYFVTREPFTGVCGHHNNLAKPDYGEMEDHCAAMYRLGNGGTALVHGDFLRPAAAPTHGDDRLRVVGSAGQVEVRDGRCELIRNDAAPADITDEAQPKPVYQEMLDAIAAGGDAIYNTADSLTVARALLAGRDAADSGCMARIDPS